MHRLVKMIVAAARNGVIGIDGRLPWHLRSDLQRFKALTMGHWLIMGRKTWDSIGRPLPGRESVIISRQSSLDIDPVHRTSVRVVGSLDEAIDLVPLDRIPFVIGGGQICRLGLPRTEQIYFTRVDCDVTGDVRFDGFPNSEWKLVRSESIPAGAHDQYPSEFQEWIRIEGGR